MDSLGKWEGEDAATGFHLVRRADGQILRIADLIEDDPIKRDRVITALKDPSHRNDRDHVDIILALGMAKEGFDWIWCEHALTVGYRSSLTEIIQIIGRATRDAPGKTVARFTNLIAEPAAADDVVAALTEGYQLARRDLVSTQVAARREFVDDLLSGGTQALAGLVERAGLFGLSLAGPHAVLIVQADQPFTDSSPQTRMLERSIMGAKADADALVSTKDGALVVVFAAPDRRAIDGVISGLRGVLPSDEPTTGVRLHRTAPVGAWRIGVGGAHQGPGGVRLSYEQAQEALELGLRFGRQERVLDAADMLMHRVLVRDDTAMRELMQAVLQPLTAARGGAEPLLRTLEAYFEANGNASLAARSLHLSVRAMTYRLAKIAELTGRDPADPAARFELQTAVVGARLLGWPAAH
jgi:sugar diacid utilization regulator